MVYKTEHSMHSKQKSLVDERGQIKIARLVRADRKTTVTHVTTVGSRTASCNAHVH